MNLREKSKYVKSFSPLKTIAHARRHHHLLLNGLYRYGSKDAFIHIKTEFPHIIQYLLHDLLRVEGFSETEVAFGLKIPLNAVREIADGNLNHATREIFLALINLYARVFCGWHHFNTE
jgi:hypothetical protein